MSESRQRWRLAFRRDEAAMYLSHLDAIHAWERALRRGRIPVSMSEGFNPRPRLAFAAPLPLGMLAGHELADLVLAERLALTTLRERLADCLPLGYVIVDMFDVWVGEPALAPQLAAADYRMTLLGIGPNELAHACDRLLAADKLPRTRAKESREIHYDLRPLIHALRVGDAPADAAVEGGGRAASIWMRLRHSQAGGTGRADEVVAALADQLGLRFSWTGGDEAEAGAPGEPDGSTSPGGIVELEVAGPVRERLWLAAELAPEGDSAASGV